MHCAKCGGQGTFARAQFAAGGHVINLEQLSDHCRSRAQAAREGRTERCPGNVLDRIE